MEEKGRYEQWVTVKDYENYQVSNLGNVRNCKTGRILKPSTVWGYLTVCLHENRKQKTCRVHKLVAIAFIPNPNNLRCINHKDENKLNNCVNNLEWCSIEYNNNYGTRNKRISETMKGIIPWNKGKEGYWKGKHLSDKHKKLLSEIKTGKKLSDEHKKRISEGLKGHIGWNRGKHYGTTK